MVGFLRLSRAKQPFTGSRVEGTVAKQQAKRRARFRPVTPTGWAVRGLRIDRGELAGCPVWMLSPAAGGSGRVVVGVHGGAYVGEIGWMHWWVYAGIVRGTGATLIAPIYPLAPVGTAAVVVPQMADLLSTLISEHGAEALGVVGDSAGAGLAMAAVQELVRRQAATPARLVLISPWLDVTVSDPASADIDDPMLDAAGLAVCGRMWAADLDPADPRVSPLFGPLAGLPPTAVYAGSLDLLYPDTTRLQQRARRESADIEFTLREGLLHAWAGIPFLPETRAVRADMLHHLVGDPT